MDQGTTIIALEEKKNRVDRTKQCKYIRRCLIFVHWLTPAYFEGEATKLGLGPKADLQFRVINPSLEVTHLRNFYQTTSDRAVGIFRMGPAKKKTPSNLPLFDGENPP